MKINYPLLFASCSLFSISCMSSQPSEEPYLRGGTASHILRSVKEKHKEQETLYLKYQEGYQKGDKDSCYALANYYYLGRQFVENPEKIKTSYYYRSGKDRIYYGEGEIKVDKEDYAKAVKLYEKAALQGHLASLWSLGECYELERGVKENLTKATTYYLEAAKANYPPAQRSLGLMYIDGSGGVGQSDYEAVKWFRKAADQGLASAQTNLGIMYILGRGVGQSDSEAIKWFRKAADQGFSNAQAKLGEIYRNGRGVEKSDFEAIKWFRKAADQGHINAQANLEGMLKNNRDEAKRNPKGKNNSRKPIPDERVINSYLGLGQLHLNSQNYSEAMKYFRKAADQGDARAYNTLGLMYEDGRGAPQSNFEAAKCYRKAADQGHAKAQTNLARMYREGQGVPQSDSEAVKWYQKAADQGFIGAQSNLGWMYRAGRGVPQSDSEAVKWYKKAADQGYAPAQLNIAEIYKNATGDVAQSDPEAMRRYQKVADQGQANSLKYPGVYYTVGLTHRDLEKVRQSANEGHADAQFYLGMVYSDGLQGVEKDSSEAMNWYRKAADQGDSLAQFCVGMMYRNGQGLNKNHLEAMNFFHKAAAQGDENALSIVKNFSKKKISNNKALLDMEKAEKWQPSEGNLVEAGNFIMVLKREKGKSPSSTEMVDYLQQKMSILSFQAEIILDELGLLEMNS